MSKSHHSALCALTLLSLIACGSGTGSNGGNVVTTTPTPTPMPTAVPTPASYNLEYYAKISASSVQSNDIKNFSETYVADGYIGKASAVAGFVWLPDQLNVNSSWIKMEWNSHVHINQVRLFGIPGGAQIKTARIYFYDSSNPSKDLGYEDVSSIPTDGTKVEVSGRSDPVTSIELKITDHGAGSNAGIAEMVVDGNRVDEEIAEGDLTPFAFIPSYDGPSSSFSKAASSFVSLSNRPSLVKDGKSTGTADDNVSWVSSGNGGSAWIRLTFDRPYSISSVKLLDRLVPNTARFMSGHAVFKDQNQSIAFTKAALTDAGAVATPTTPLASKVIEISFDPITTTDQNTGLSEIQVTGSYKPGS